MPLQPVHLHDPATVHGISYSDDFLDALPVLRNRPDPHPPVRALSASQFSDLHLAHLTSHAPDHVLFPFLHGLEGDNEQQNAFFAASRPRGDVPHFRGLVWVACDEDTEEICDVDDLEDDDDDDDYSTSSSLDSFGPTDLDEDVPMQLDPTVEGPTVSGCPPPDPLEKPPVAPPRMHIASPPLSQPSQHTKPAFLTSAFRARDLLRTRAETDGSTTHVFAEPKIPDGISLRNFGIQVVSPSLLPSSSLSRAHRGGVGGCGHGGGLDRRRSRRRSEGRLPADIFRWTVEAVRDSIGHGSGRAGPRHIHASRHAPLGCDELRSSVQKPR